MSHQMPAAIPPELQPLASTVQTVTLIELSIDFRQTNILDVEGVRDPHLSTSSIAKHVGGKLEKLLVQKHRHLLIMEA